MMKKTFALLLAAVMMLALLTACGGGDKPADTTPPADTSAPADTGSDAAKPEEPAAGGNIGVCIYKFDDAFMTTYRNALEAILKENAEVVEKHPLVKTLLVPGESLAVARLKVKEPGTAHYANFQKLSRELVEAAQEKVRPEYEKYVKEE